MLAEHSSHCSPCSDLDPLVGHPCAKNRGKTVWGAGVWRGGMGWGKRIWVVAPLPGQRARRGSMRAGGQGNRRSQPHASLPILPSPPSSLLPPPPPPQPDLWGRPCPKNGLFSCTYKNQGVTRLGFSTHCSRAPPPRLTIGGKKREKRQYGYPRPRASRGLTMLHSVSPPSRWMK